MESQNLLGKEERGCKIESRIMPLCQCRNLQCENSACWSRHLRKHLQEAEKLSRKELKSGFHTMKLNPDSTMEGMGSRLDK